MAPRRVQNVPDCLSRDLMMVLHNSFDHARTDEEMLFPKDGAAHGGRCAKCIPLRRGSALRPCDPRWEPAELATEFPRVTVQVSRQIVQC
jgi:hypothetical protein